MASNAVPRSVPGDPIHGAPVQHAAPTAPAAPAVPAAAQGTSGHERLAPGFRNPERAASGAKLAPRTSGSRILPTRPFLIFLVTFLLSIISGILVPSVALLVLFASGGRGFLLAITLPVLAIWAIVTGLLLIGTLFILKKILKQNSEHGREPIGRNTTKSVNGATTAIGLGIVFGLFVGGLIPVLVAYFNGRRPN